MNKGFGLLMVLVSFLVIMFLFLSGFYLIGGNRNLPGNGNNASPIKKAEDMKIKYNERNKETIDYLDAEDK